MWPVAFAALIFGGPFGMALFLAAGVTAGIRAWKVDPEYAKRGEMPPSHRLVEKWLENRKATGQTPASAQVKPYGSWAYAKQRWQAMWEDLGDQHRTVRDQYRQAKADALARGEVPPPKPTVKETLAGWKWQLDQLTSPTTQDQPEAPQAGPEADWESNPNAHRPTTAEQDARPDEATTETQPLWPSVGLCGKCGRWSHLTLVGQCRPCVDAAETGYCAHCEGLMVRDGDVMRHGPNQNCDAVAPVGNPLPKPAATDPDQTSTTPAQVEPGPGVTATEGDTMTTTAQPTTQMSGEVTGTRSAIVYCAAMADTHASHGGNEGFLTSLANMEVGEGDIGQVRAAMEASKNAGAMWQAAADSIHANNAAVREAYASAPDAANKTANINE